MSSFTNADVILLVVSAIPLFLFLFLGIRARFRGLHALLVLTGLALVSSPAVLHVFQPPINGPITWVAITAGIPPDIADAIVGGLFGPLCILAGLVLELRSRRRAEEMAAHRARLQQAVLDALPHVVFMVDGDGRILFANNAAHRLFEALGSVELRDILTKITPATNTPEVRELLRFQEELGISAKELFSVGDRLVAVTGQAIPGSGRGNNLVHLMQDLTALARFAGMTRELVANMAHDLRTPLTSIRGYLELLLDGDLGPLPLQQRQALAVIEQHARGLEQLVNDYLDLSRLEAGVLPLRKEPFDLRVAVDEAILTVQRSFDAKGLSLGVRLPSDPVVVHGDQQRIVQVLQNLLNNAEKYTPPGGSVTVTLSDGPQWAQVDVEDTGVGIPEEEQAQVFSRFYRGSAAAKSGTPGTGLGLPIAKSLVELHGGRLWLRSTPGQGSVFSFQLPKASEEG
jgi:two-component system phosphate regulon sensor histidine kinase PhoR